jgi:hypothetical protein
MNILQILKGSNFQYIFNKTYLRHLFPTEFLEKIRTERKTEKYKKLELFKKRILILNTVR